MVKFPVFDEPILQAICEILGDTQTGLTGSEIGQTLERCGIEDPFPSYTKRIRLFEALKRRQQQDKCGNLIVGFIYQAMHPARYTGNPTIFEDRRSSLNKVLAFAGYTLLEEGKLQPVSTAKTLTEAQERAHQLRRELIDRQVHSDVLKFCQAELLQDNYFHAVFEATKSVAEKIRQMTGLTEDGCF